MSTFPLDQMDEHLLKQIVRKFTATSGAAFYRSCRGAKDFGDRVKPGNRRTSRTVPNIPLEFSRIEIVEVEYCDTNYIKTIVLPEVAAVGGVGRLDIGKMSEGDAQLLIAAANPETVKFWDDHHDPTSPIFENIKHICIYAVKRHDESYWRTKKLFELATNRRSITLHLCHSSTETIASFIENWLKGEKTGTLERLTVIPYFLNWYADEVRTARKEMEDMLKSHIKTEEGYIVERGGLDRLRIAVDFATLQVDFYFS